MDSITSSALEEICAAGLSGVPLAALWTKLRPSVASAGLDLCAAVKSAIWSALLQVPSVRFVSPGGGVRYTGTDSAVQRLEEAEGLGLSVVAEDHLRDSFVGLYDLRAPDAGISQHQRRALSLLAAARSNGITQSQLAKEFGKNGNNMFFIVRNLESQGLVTRHSTIVWKKDAFHEGDSSNTSTMSTNTVYLSRFAKHLGSQQRLEVTKEDKNCSNNEDENDSAVNGDCTPGERGKEEVLVGDFLPALKAVCDKLEASYNKVLLISDIKRDLGYQKCKGHRRWRNICRRLKDAGVVEEFRAEVNKKEASCLRLLKGYSLKHFEQKSFGSGDDNFEEHLIKFGQRHQITDQFVELPIEHQIYDMIDAEGPTGLTLTEVCRRLGLNNKKNYIRFLNMFARFGMILQADNCNRGKVYRVWTSRNFTPESCNVFHNISEDFHIDNDVSNARAVDLHEKSAQPTLLMNRPASEDGTGNVNNEKIENIFSQVHSEDGGCSALLPPSNPEEIFNEPRDIIPNSELGLVVFSTESNGSPLKMCPSALDKPHRIRSYQTYPGVSLTPISIQREQRILSRLQEEKFILRPELHRWLENLEPDKQTGMDNKTLVRILNKLQKQGQCRCIDVSVPVARNCHRERLVQVILQPSVQGLPPELLGLIHDRMRSFDKLIRREGSHKIKKVQSIPVLNHVQRLSKHACPDIQASRSEVMRANGFVNSKIIRAKLLHAFLWDYVNKSPGLDGPSSSGYHRCDLKNPYSTCKLFILSEAIKTIPFELFLQTIGSCQKFDDMIERCNSCMRLSDLPEQDYSCLMDDHATERLSRVIDILRRMKLVRVVTEHSIDGSMVPNSTLTQALELKPYIEEPLSIAVPSSSFMSLDLRPRKRHDFILSDKNAVDVYWKTLEYCYAAADAKAALHAFPGSTVHEVFHQRSWAAVQVISAEQRAELVKRIVNNSLGKRISFKDCEEIAKDLDLTLEQVLRMYYDKQRLSKSSRGSNPNTEEFQSLRIEHPSSSRKRKRSSEKQRLTHAEDDAENLKSVQMSPATSGEENLSKISSVELDNKENLSRDLMDSGSCEEDKERSSHLSAFQVMNTTHQKKFSWTEEADRHLIIQYVRYRAALGAKFNRVDWVSLHDLPAPPSTCRRRMQLLNSNIKFREHIMRLCNLLSKRYVKQVNKATENLKRDDSSKSGKIFRRNFFDGAEHSIGSDFEGERWDNFDDVGIKGALDEALRLKRMDKLKSTRRSISERADFNLDAEECDPRGTQLISSDTPIKKTQQYRCRYNRSSKNLGLRAAQKFRTIMNEGISVDRQAYESLAVSNAVELFKLIFLSNSRAPQVAILLAETLRRYSEHDLFTAWNYLREKKIMEAEANGTHTLSKSFFRSIYESPFPCGSGNTAAKFNYWLLKTEKDTKEEWIDLTADLQCGDIFHLFALISLGEFSIMPFLPEEGVGEDSENSKRKADNIESNTDNVAKRLKSVVEGDRKQKGFPGIVVSISRETISVDGLSSFMGREICGDLLPFDENDPLSNTLCQTIGSSASHSDHMEEIPSCVSDAHITGVSSESVWEAMTGYAARLMSICSDQEQQSPFHPELFRTICAAVQRAGDQGLGMEEVSQVLGMQGEEIPERVVEVLQAFGRALKVNAYDSVHVVDSLYCPKYLLTSFATSSLNPTPVLSMKFPSISDDKNYSDNNSQRNADVKNDHVHKVTILNRPEEVAQPLNRCIEEVEGYIQGEMGISELSPVDSQSSRPILPWINGDGSINVIVYKALTRRVFGTVMQNPGILEDGIVFSMDALNPQSCKQLLESMILDNHLIVRTMHQTTSGSPPTLLASLMGSNFLQPESVHRRHYFANPLSTSLL